jgi:hypothetical protein
MAINITYAPDINKLGQLAYSSGYGRRRNELQDQAARMAMQRESHRAQMEAQLRSQEFQRENWQRQADWESSRYERDLADKQAALEADRTWREQQAQQAHDWQRENFVSEQNARRQNFDYETAARAKSEIDITTQKAKLEDDKLKQQYAALDAEMAARENGYDTAGMDPELQSVDYDWLERAREQVRQKRLGLEKFVPKKPDSVVKINDETFIQSGDGGLRHVPTPVAKPPKPEDTVPSVEERMIRMMDEAKAANRPFNRADIKLRAKAELEEDLRRIEEERRTGIKQEPKKSLLQYIGDMFTGGKQQVVEEQQARGKAPVAGNSSAPSTVGGTGAPMRGNLLQRTNEPIRVLRGADMLARPGEVELELAGQQAVQPAPRVDVQSEAERAMADLKAAGVNVSAPRPVEVESEADMARIPSGALYTYRGRTYRRN